ncbi:chromate transport protein [Corallococcus sp. CAG:1435]|nr:chromate transport protein [Corallococcus sp. CAG:1435]
MVFLTLFWEYFKIGLFTIGGGYAMLPMVQQVIEKYGWLTRKELINFIGVAESTPGPFAINLATFVGINVGSQTSLGIFGGFLGAAVATFAVVLPSLIIIIIVTKLFQKFRTNKYVQGVLYGIRPVVVGLILSAVLSVGCAVILPNLNLTSINKEGFSQFNWVSLIIVAVFFPLSRIKIKGKKIHPILLILAAAAVGVVVFGVCNVVQ